MSARFFVADGPRSGFVLDPYRWVEGTVGEDYYDPSDAGFFHVTTRVTSVRRSGLKSRKQLRGERIIGLGGGWSDTAPAHISFVWSLHRAQWLAGAMRVASRAAHGQIEATDIVRAVFEWSDWPGGEPWSAAIDDALQGGAEEEVREMLADLFGNVIVGEPWPGMDPLDLLDTSAQLEWLSFNAERIDQEYASGRMRYRLIQDIETALDASLEQLMASNVDYVVECVPLVGFTADHSVFAAADPSEIAIVQAAIRPGAPEELVIRECELRFHSDDVALVRTDVEAQGPIPAAESDGP